MNKDTSTYLDCARFLAAFSVMLCHIDDFMVKSVFRFIDHIGVESVGVFFVLSGFVIGYAVEYREKNLRSYTVNRAARLYSVVIPCLALTLLLDTLGKYFFPAIYYDPESFLRESSHILFSLSFLDYSWLMPHPFAPGNDGPYWSLCFEVPYYIMFGAAWYLRGFQRWLVPLAALFLFGANILIYLPLWLLGLGIYRLCHRISLGPALARGIFALSILLWAGFELLLSYFNICPTVPAIIKAAPILLYGSGICFGLSIIGFHFARIPLRAIGKPASWLAGATFTLYLLHFPLAWFLHGALAASPLAAWPAPVRWLLLAAVTFLLVLLTAQFTERRKQGWRRGIERLFPRGAGRPSQSGAAGSGARAD